MFVLNYKTQNPELFKKTETEFLKKKKEKKSHTFPRVLFLLQTVNIFINSND